MAFLFDPETVGVASRGLDPWARSPPPGATGLRLGLGITTTTRHLGSGGGRFGASMGHLLANFFGWGQMIILYDNYEKSRIFSLNLY